MWSIQLGPGEHYEEKGKSRFFTQGAFIIKREGRRSYHIEYIQARVNKTNIYKKL